MTFARRTCLLALVSVLAALLAGCSGSPYEKAEKLFSAGEYAGAITAYEQVLKEKPEHGRALRKLGIAHYRLKQYPSAVERLEQSLVVSDHFDTHLYLGQTFAREQRQEEAARHWAAYVGQIDASVGTLEFQQLLSSNIKDCLAKLTRGEMTLAQVADKLDSLLGK